MQPRLGAVEAGGGVDGGAHLHEELVDVVAGRVEVDRRLVLLDLLLHEATQVLQCDVNTTFLGNYNFKNNICTDCIPLCKQPNKAY